MKQVMIWFLAVCGCLVASIPASAQKPSLKGSKSSVNRMAEEARVHEFSRLKTADKIMKFFNLGLFVQLRGNGNYRIHGVSHPYVRPEVRTFVERISAQSRAKSGKLPAPCPSGLVVTSSLRPLDEQPKNASPKSVHPTGMAVDFHVPETATCRAWFEKTLLGLESKKVLEATRERRPPHYHVAVFPGPYGEYLASLKAPKKTVPKKRR